MRNQTGNQQPFKLIKLWKQKKLKDLLETLLIQRSPQVQHQRESSQIQKKMIIRVKFN